MVFVLPSGLAAAAGPSGAGASTTLWAYGAVRTVSFSGTTESGWQYQGSATFGYSVVLDQINTSANGSTFELTLNRTMGALFDLEFCFPTCAKAVYSANETYHSWETTHAWANFTTLGSVTEATGSVAAIALLDTHSTVAGQLLETSASSAPSANRSRSLSVSVSGGADVTFATPLGLIPLNLSLAQPQSWTSTAAFTATGAAIWSFDYAAAGPLHTISIVRNGSLAVNRSGSVTAIGSYSLGNSVSFNGVTYPAIQLVLLGPFSVREGIILVPSGSDLFGGSSQPWSANQTGAATVSMTSLDVLPSADGHLGLVASAWLYDASGAVDANVAGSSGGMSALATSSASPAPAPPTALQGAPMSPSAAQSTQNCLVTGSSCPSASGGGTPGTPFRGLFGLGVLVVAVVVIAGVVLVAERRRMPPPAYPNANLYPPGASAPVNRPPTGRAPPTSPPPAEDDPLGHLW
jgi:hypothetical protein